MAAIVSAWASKCTSTPVSTGRDSSREAARATCSIGGDDGAAVEREDALRVELRQAREVVGGEGVQRVLARPAGDAQPRGPVVAASVTVSPGSARTISCARRAGTTTEPGSSTCSASAGTRSESSRSVAASSSGSSALVAVMRMPLATCMPARVEAARPTTARRSARMSLRQVIRMRR